MELAALRQAIFPEIIIGQPKLFEDQKHSIKTLDVQQEKAAKNLGDGHRILKGVAGSGKSVVLACRAKYLRLTNPEWRILVVCFNISLLSSLKHHIFGSGHDEKITITHFHGLAKNLIKASLRKNMSESGEEYNERIGKLIIESLEKEADPIRYDAILIDEGQDFTDYWVKALTLILNPETNSILFCYDPAQNVFGRKRPNWKSVGLMVQGKRPTELKDCYRNTLQILRLANKFSNNSPDESVDDDETLTNKLTPNTHHCKEGSKPIIEQMTGHIDSIKYVIGAIQKATSSGKYSLKNIGVIVAHNKNWISTFAHEATQALGAEAVFDMTNQKHKMQLDLDHDSIKLMHVESCKGLEFSIVFLIGLEELPRLSRNNVDAERCLSYVGITRAQEHLFILGHKQHGFFQELQTISADA